MQRLVMVKIEEHKQKMNISSNHTLHILTKEMKSIKGKDIDKIKYREGFSYITIF
jgi:hypothetical protein